MRNVVLVFVLANLAGGCFFWTWTRDTSAGAFVTDIQPVARGLAIDRCDVNSHVRASVAAVVIPVPMNVVEGTHDETSPDDAIATKSCARHHVVLPAEIFPADDVVSVPPWCKVPLVRWRATRTPLPPDCQPYAIEGSR